MSPLVVVASSRDRTVAPPHRFFEARCVPCSSRGPAVSGYHGNADDSGASPSTPGGVTRRTCASRLSSLRKLRGPVYWLERCLGRVVACGCSGPRASQALQLPVLLACCRIHNVRRLALGLGADGFQRVGKALFDWCRRRECYLLGGARPR